MASNDRRAPRRRVASGVQGWQWKGQSHIICLPPSGPEGGRPKDNRGYLGPFSIVADGERRGILEALQSDEDMLLILTDSMVAKATVVNLARGAAPRSGIEREIKAALQRRQESKLDTGISWIRAHIGVRGNELADQAARFHSYRGEIA